MKKKFFIITIDTEGDNLWSINENGDNTENSRYIERFQKLANKFGFKPVYLTNYEMANDDYFCNLMKGYLKKEMCEIGMHLHAWNTPPYYKIERKTKEKSYLIEYPIEIMEKKLEVMTNLLREKFETEIISHRAGRWAINDAYFHLLRKYGYKIDCSVTPYISWKKHLGQTGKLGIDYRQYSKNTSEIIDGILEVPMSIRIIKRNYKFSVKNLIKKIFLKRATWMRPSSEKIENLIALADHIFNEKDTDYLEFMIHSSELMPGGSPYFPTESSIEELYKKLEILFKRISDNYIGITFKDYYKQKMEEKNDSHIKGNI